MVLGSLFGKSAAVTPESQDVIPSSSEAENIQSKSVIVKAKDAASGVAAMGKEHVSSTVEQIRSSLDDFVKSKVQLLVEHIIDKIPKAAQDALEDEEAPNCVNKGKDRLVQAVWPDIREEIMLEVASLLHALPDEEQEPDKKACCCLAFFRYHLFPYDKGFWGQLRDPVWVILKLIALIPVAGISPFFFLFEFVIIDKTDEFQLVRFILGFKGTQFISMGIIRALVGIALYMSCLTARAHPDAHDCHEKGPGSGWSFWPTVAGFFIQVVLIWITFLILRYGNTVEKGKLKVSDAATTETPEFQGGYLNYFLWYDLFAFLLCSLIVVFVVATTPVKSIHDWPVEHAVYAAQVIYALLSIPFFIFTLPGIQVMLTHARPTAYDSKGQCRKPKRTPALEESHAELKTKQHEPVVTESEAKRLFDKLLETCGFK